MKINKLNRVALFFLISLNLQCINDDGPDSPVSNCGALAIIDAFSYENAATSAYTINNAFINEDCLVISILASGCDGNSWTMQLMDSENVSDSSPPQRNVKLFLINDESCQAVVNATESFDISGLKVDNVNEIIINIDSYTESITYTY